MAREVRRRSTRWKNLCGLQQESVPKANAVSHTRGFRVKKRRATVLWLDRSGARCRRVLCSDGVEITSGGRWTASGKEGTSAWRRPRARVRVLPSVGSLPPARNQGRGFSRFPCLMRPRWIIQPFNVRSHQSSCESGKSFIRVKMSELSMSLNVHRYTDTGSLTVSKAGGRSRRAAQFFTNTCLLRVQPLLFSCGCWRGSLRAVRRLSSVEPAHAYAAAPTSSSAFDGTSFVDPPRRRRRPTPTSAPTVPRE